MEAWKLLFTLAGLLCLSEMGDSLKCHQCSSFRDSLCADPFHFEPTREDGEKKPRTMDFYKDCPNDGKNYTICRKIYQNVRGDERIIRSCGYEKYKSDCYKTVLEEYNTYVCQCEGDGCNGANATPISFLATLVGLLVAKLFH